MQLRRIVVATDASAAGRAAVRTGLDLAARASARLTVVRVVPLESMPLSGERLREWIEPELADYPGVQVELAIASGLPGIEICRFAERRGADLLVLGRKRRSAMARLLAGDTAEAVIRRSRVPCLFVEQDSLPLAHLLVALDGSDRGMRVYAATRDFSDAVDAALTVVTVEEQNAPRLADDVPPLPLSRSSRLRRELAPRGGREAAVATPEVGVAVRQGPVVPEVLAEVSASGADVLAFGNHRGGPSGILEAGGTARHLLHAAPVSVLAVPL